MKKYFLSLIAITFFIACTNENWDKHEIEGITFFAPKGNTPQIRQKEYFAGVTNSTIYFGSEHYDVYLSITYYPDLGEGHDIMTGTENDIYNLKTECLEGIKDYKEKFLISEKQSSKIVCTKEESWQELYNLVSGRKHIMIAIEKSKQEKIFSSEKFLSKFKIN